MGYIKVAKAGTAFDIVSCENVGDCKIDTTGSTDDIVIKYLSGYKLAITAGTVDLVQDDVQLIVDNIQKFAGTSGPAPLVKLSQVVTGTGVSAIS